MQNALDAILSRLNRLESDHVRQSPSNVGNLPAAIEHAPQHDESEASELVERNTDLLTGAGCSKPIDLERQSEASTTAQTLLQIIKALPNRSQQYFVSNFDPSLHNIDTWCEEVDRAQLSNSWEDCECLSRVSNCLKGDAKTWLNEWVTPDRSWSNFKRDFKPLCSRKLDYANILFEVMNTTSDKYTSYAEYARRSLLRLRIVKGLSEELMVSIAIRGITDAQIHAAATNANLTTENLVSFLSIYSKPAQFSSVHRPSTQKPRAFTSQPGISGNINCFNCGQAGHKSRSCTAKQKPMLNCTFCKKPGHSEVTCFAKGKSEPRN